MTEFRRTNGAFTLTRDGNIPHRARRLQDGTTMVAPVLVRVVPQRDPVPERTHRGHLIYALPGGEVWIP